MEGIAEEAKRALIAKKADLLKGISVTQFSFLTGSILTIWPSGRVILTGVRHGLTMYMKEPM